ncbi:hypothetical protein BH09ACT5_BH09ACT5_18710 [soil metagenome]
MVSIRSRLHGGSSDEGISLVEVLVAMMVFAVIALGVIASSATILRMTADTRSREVATNLAASELDRVRAFADIFDIVNDKFDTIIGGKTYTITRSTEWVQVTGSDVACGDSSTTSTFTSKRVNVTVDWSGRLNSTQPARSDTLISPDTRVNDPSRGTIRISVLGSKGTGIAGVAVSVAPATSSTGTALEEQPRATDSDGCSYALKVVPGTYTVTISKSGSLSTTQSSSPSATVVVAAGGSVAAQFEYDTAATFNLSYASNYTASALKFPTNLDTTYLSTAGQYYRPSPRVSQIALYPVPSGYSGIAGKYISPIVGNAGCVSVDPAAWAAGTVNNVALAAGSRTAVGTDPGTQASMAIPMGVATVKFTTVDYLIAVSATPPAAALDPGCANPMTYTFGEVLVNGNTTVALPFGSWTLYSSATATGTRTVIPGGNITVNTRGQVSGTTVTLDPRNTP